MISDGRSDADRKMLIKCIGQHLPPAAQAWRLRRPSPLIAAPDTRNGHADLLSYLIPDQSLITELHDLMGGSGMSGSAMTHHHAGARS